MIEQVLELGTKKGSGAGSNGRSNPFGKFKIFCSLVRLEEEKKSIQRKRNATFLLRAYDAKGGSAGVLREGFLK